MTKPRVVPKIVFWDITRRSLIAIRDYNEVMFEGRRSAIAAMINKFLEDFEHKGYHE